jgi:CTP:molybdopterin cytidylyltransferase MocA
MINPFIDTSCIILSAGNSSRMGVHKALLNFDGETMFIQKITHTYVQAGFDQVIVVLNGELYDQIKERNLFLFSRVMLVINQKPDLGRFYSLQTGVQLLKPWNYCFFQNIDNPFTSVELLNELISHKTEAEIIIPTFHKKAGHPALFSPLVSSEILNTINSKTRIDIFLKKFNTKVVETNDPNILVNINSLEEYLSAGLDY